MSILIDAALAGGTPDLELLDAPSLRGAGGERLLLERKMAALIALIALDGARPRGEIAALLWPEASPAQARNSLRQRLFRLRRDAGREIVESGPELRLAEGLTHDLFDPSLSLVADPQARPGELLGKLDYSDCLDLSDWVDRARERWRERRANALAEVASRHEARGEIAMALRYAERAAIDAPLREHAQRRVMRLHYLRGDRAAALAAFERCRRALAAELGTAPDRETRELARLIDASAATTDAPRPTSPPVAVLRPPRLVGRDAQRLRIDAALGERRVLLLCGEPGIGKSRLLDDAQQRQPQALRVDTAPGETGLSYALAARLVRAAQARFEVALEPWVRDELARIAPEFGAAPAGRIDPLRLQQALAVALDRWADAGLAAIVLDDLHRADAASLEALLARALAPRSRRLGWLFGARAGELPPGLAELRDGSAETGVEVLALDGLDTAGIEALLDCLALAGFEAARWAAPLAAHSGGNPLFALETLRALLALADGAPRAPGGALPVPAGLHELIERRLAALSAPALRLARLAALAGHDFDPDLAAAVLEVHPLDIVAAWSELEQAQILADGRYTHDVIADTVRRGLPKAIAAALHARLADRMQALARPSARIAPHWVAAAAWPSAAQAWRAAAQAAQKDSRRIDEVALWVEAAQCFERADRRAEAFDARADSIESLILVHGVAHAQPIAQRLVADAATGPQRIRALTAQATVSLMAGDAITGETAARGALEAAEREGAPWLRFEAARLLAVALTQGGKADAALAVLAPLQPLVEAEGSLEQRGHFWSDYAYVLKGALRLRETASALRKAMHYARELGDNAELATLTSNLATVEGNFGHLDTALELALQSRAMRDPLGEMGGPAIGAIDLYVAIYSAGNGRYADALANLDRADACFVGNGQTLWRTVAANHRAGVWLQLGQFARAGQALAGLAADTPAAMRGRSATLAARLARALGQPAGDAMQRALDLLRDAGDPYLRMLAEVEASHSLDADAAQATCEAVRAEAMRREHDGAASRATAALWQHRVRGGAVTGTQADELARYAASLARVAPADMSLPEAWWAVHRAWLALGDAQAADAALRSGFEWIAMLALPQVPEPFRESFLHRQRINRDLLAAAAQRLGLRPTTPA